MTTEGNAAELLERINADFRGAKFDDIFSERPYTDLSHVNEL